jgi:predicted nuclease of predicted toxin-antitoxin system
MRFLVDMCLDVRVAQSLRAQGHDAIHLAEQGLQRLPNGDIFRKAADENRTVLTLDLDFSEIAALTSGSKSSVIVFRLRNPSLSCVTDRLSAVLKESAVAIEKGAVISVEDSRHRVRYLPVGVQTGKE